MKKFVLAAVAASMLATPAMAAATQNHGQNWGHAPQQQYQGPKKVVVKQVYKPAPKQQYRNWQRGQRFDSRYAQNYRQVDYRGFNGRLKAPPRGYRYVQSGHDVVLVAITSGIIGAIFGNLIR